MRSSRPLDLRYSQTSVRPCAPASCHKPRRPSGHPARRPPGSNPAALVHGGSAAFHAAMSASLITACVTGGASVARPPLRLPPSPRGADGATGRDARLPPRMQTRVDPLFSSCPAASAFEREAPLCAAPSWVWRRRPSRFWRVSGWRFLECVLASARGAAPRAGHEQACQPQRRRH